LPNSAGGRCKVVHLNQKCGGKSDEELIHEVVFVPKDRQLAVQLKH
jgi:hypothetical protein